MNNKLSQKQEYFYNLLLDFSKEKNDLPTLNEVKKISLYKSYNTIYEYLNKLEEKGYLIYSKEKKQITFLKDLNLKKEILTIPFLEEKTFFNIENYFDKEKNYIAVQVKDNSLKSFSIFYQDILIVEKDTTYLNNKLVLVYYNNSYKIYKYIKKNGFNHLINNKESILLENTNYILGKVVSLVRKNMKYIN